MANTLITVNDTMHIRYLMANLAYFGEFLYNEYFKNQFPVYEFSKILFSVFKHITKLRGIYLRYRFFVPKNSNFEVFDIIK